MADKGPGPQELVRKRITAEIKRLEFMIESQELEVMETYDKIERLKENILASQKEILKQTDNLASVDDPEGGEEA
jgi:predicted nucleotide-binding protein (sugar kinase/HSP70/actin superfamily)